VFERFTDRARRVVVLAQEEARLLNHNYIGTEHLLLGLVHEGQGVASVALESLGISLGVVRSSVSEIIGVGGSEPFGHIPFTPRAKKVLELSMREALQLGHNYIGTEHILLGLVREGEGVAAQVLTGLGVDLGTIRQRIVELLNDMPASEPVQAGARVSFGAGIGGIFEPALHESRRLGDRHVGAEHVVLAALDSEESIAGRVLRSFGLTKAEVEGRIREMRGEGEQATPE
jgi:ATP-dependent Clp protease ATP-binding subunit ClpA